MGEPTVFEAPRMNKVQKEMLVNTPFVEFLGLEAVDSDKGIAYQLSFRGAYRQYTATHFSRRHSR